MRAVIHIADLEDEAYELLENQFGLRLPSELTESVYPAASRSSQIGRVDDDEDKDAEFER